MKKQEKAYVINLRLPEDLYQGISEIAKKQFNTQQGVIKQAIARFLEEEGKKNE